MAAAPGGGGPGGPGGLPSRREQVQQKFARCTPPGVPVVGCAEVRAALEGGAGGGAGPARPPVVVDCRTEAEQRVSMLPGAVTKRELERRLARAKRAGEAAPAIVTYCTIGARSGTYAKELLARGFEDVSNLEGSILGWVHEGHEVVERQRGGREVPTKCLHCFGANWALAPEGFEQKVFDRKPWARVVGETVVSKVRSLPLLRNLQFWAVFAVIVLNQGQKK